MKIIGYGEDALTLKVLFEKVDCILEGCQDSTRIGDDNCIVFYRPSFGRGGKDRAGFGEFDFIIATPKAVYLGETKNHYNKNKHVQLSEAQIRRHCVFNEYYKVWCKTQKNQESTTFIDLCNKDEDFVKFKPEIKMPNAQSRLAINIINIFKAISRITKSSNVVNILLLVNSSDHKIENISISKVDFKRIEMDVNYSKECIGNDFLYINSCETYKNHILERIYDNM